MLKGESVVQSDLIPNDVLDELIRRYRNRWPLREVPDVLASILEVLE